MMHISGTSSDATESREPFLGEIPATRVTAHGGTKTQKNKNNVLVSWPERQFGQGILQLCICSFLG